MPPCQYNTKKERTKQDGWKISKSIDLRLHSEAKYVTIIQCMEKFMSEALNEAKKAYQEGEVPIGAVIVKDGQIIARGHNLVGQKNDPTAHAEIVALRNAAQVIGGWRLTECDLYVTIEPCAMCAGAMVLSRIRKVYIGAMDPKAGACGSVMNVIQEERLNHYIEMETGIMQDECRSIIKNFFREKRKKKSEDL